MKITVLTATALKKLLSTHHPGRLENQPYTFVPRTHMTFVLRRQQRLAC
jgi:hypothetical protein